MAIFSPGDYQRLDYRLMQNGSVNLYYRTEVLNEDIASLKRLGYKIAEFDCRTWKGEAEMHEQFAKKLEFPDYYGENLDALNDCFRYIEIPDESGQALIFLRFDDFAAREERTARILLDIIASISRTRMLFGKRLFALAQSDDLLIRFDGLGAYPAIWNRREWLKKNRGL